MNMYMCVHVCICLHESVHVYMHVCGHKDKSMCGWMDIGRTACIFMYLCVSQDE